MVDTGIDPRDKEKIIALISALAPQAKIILFGSRARGNFLKSSDIDIALDAGKLLPELAVSEIIDVLRGTDIMHKIDVLDFNDVPHGMQSSIMQEGIIWKS